LLWFINMMHGHFKEEDVAGVRVPVIEKATGRILTGEEAPLSSELADWLLQHPGYVLIHAFVGGSFGY